MRRLDQNELKAPFGPRRSTGHAHHPHARQPAGDIRHGRNCSIIARHEKRPADSECRCRPANARRSHPTGGRSSVEFANLGRARARVPSRAAIRLQHGRQRTKKFRCANSMLFSWRATRPRPIRKSRRLDASATQFSLYAPSSPAPSGPVFYQVRGAASAVRERAGADCRCAATADLCAELRGPAPSAPSPACIAVRH